jgi:hypothetical protein
MNVKGTDAMERLHRRPSVPTVIATVALVFAMAGVAPAASKLINGKNIKKGTVTGTQIKDHSIKKVDLAADALVAGPKGATGPQGPKGNDGATGQDGSPGQNGTNGTDGTDGTNGVDGQGPAYFITLPAAVDLTGGAGAANVITLGSTTALELKPWMVFATGQVEAGAADTVVACEFKVGAGPTLHSADFTVTVKAGETGTIAGSWGRMVPSGTVTVACTATHDASVTEMTLSGIEATSALEQH